MMMMCAGAGATAFVLQFGTSWAPLSFSNFPVLPPPSFVPGKLPPFCINQKKQVPPFSVFCFYKIYTPQLLPRIQFFFSIAFQYTVYDFFNPNLILFCHCCCSIGDDQAID